jgi:hypothetical protein
MTVRALARPPRPQGVIDQGGCFQWREKLREGASASGKGVLPIAPQSSEDSSRTFGSATKVGFVYIGEPCDRSCAYRKSNPGILMVQSTQNRATENESGCLGGA